jgi:hypothetical protein
MKFSNNLPKNLEKTISDLARAREKAAKQKYLLDLGESLVMHLCSFVLGEYKNSGLTSLELEKSFLRNSKNIAFGIYLGWLRESSKFLNAQKCPSEIHELLHGSHDFVELWEYNSVYSAMKTEIELGSNDYQQSIEKALKNNPSKVNLLKFFDLFIELRNRVAHPHKEVKGKIISWPFSEEYFDTTNPYLEQALRKVINELSKIWEFRQYVVESNEEGLLTLKHEDSGEYSEFEKKTDFSEGVRVFANSSNTVLLSDWKLLIKAGDEAIEKIRQEEELLRNKATIEDLKESIVAALDDQQISLDELNFFESLGKTKMGLSKEQIKQLILEVANGMGIEDPFPEVDKRFIEVIDNAITTKTYNEFLLKLTGQQYGVDSNAFDKVFLERTFTLGVDPDEIRKNKVLQFTVAELTAFQGLMAAHKWLLSMGVFRKFTKESIFKIKDDSYQFGTKEYWHRTSFLALDSFVKTRLQKLVLDEELEWDTKQNNWQIGVMTGYAWCTFYPKNLPSKKILALHFSLYSSGDAAVGYLPDWKDYKDIKNYGLLLNVFVEHLKSFALEYAEDLKRYPNLVLWDSLNNNTYYSFTESINRFPWFYDHIYGFEQIQFYHTAQEITTNPSLLIDSFDISFNLFKGLFEAVNRDYMNMLNNEYLIDKYYLLIKEKLDSIENLLVAYGLCDSENLEQDSKALDDDEIALELQEEFEDKESINELKGSVHLGYFAREFRPKVKGYPVSISFQIKQDYLNNKLKYLIYVSCAGYLQNEIHRPIEQVLENLENLSFDNAEFYFKRSKFLVKLSIDELEYFDPIPLTQFFLRSLAEECAQTYTSFLGLKINNTYLIQFEDFFTKELDRATTILSPLFSNVINCERNWMKGNRFLDYVYSSKGVSHSIGWGLDFTNEQLFGGVIMHVGNSLKGALLMEQMEQMATTQKDWKFITKGASEVTNFYWVLDNNLPCIFSASSENNRNHKANHAFLNNQKTYWAAAKQDLKQWWQVELPETMTISKLLMKGSPHGKSFVKRFNLMYSVDKKNWQNVNDIEGLNDGFSCLEFTFENPFNAKYIRVLPTDFVGFPGFRIDFCAKKIVPSKIELQWLVPIASENDFTLLVNEFEEKINQLKAFKGLGV